MGHGRELSDAFKAAIFSKETEEVFLVLVTVSHSQLATPLRIVPNTENIFSNGNTFYAMPCEITLISDSEESTPSAKLRVDNLDRIFTVALRTISTPPTVSLELIRASTPDTIEAGFYDLQMRIVKIDVNYLEGDLTLESFLNEPYPGHEMGPAYFEGLF